MKRFALMRRGRGEAGDAPPATPAPASAVAIKSSRRGHATGEASVMTVRVPRICEPTRAGYRYSPLNALPNADGSPLDTTSPRSLRSSILRMSLERRREWTRRCRGGQHSPLQDALHVSVLKQGAKLKRIGPCGDLHDRGMHGQEASVVWRRASGTALADLCRAKRLPATRRTKRED